MIEEYTNKYKLDYAQVEAAKTGGDVKEIYLRMGGHIKVIEDKVSDVKPAAKKPKKK